MAVPETTEAYEDLRAMAGTVEGYDVGKAPGDP